MSEPAGASHLPGSASQTPGSASQTPNSRQRRRRPNRFAKYRVLVALISVVALLVFLELVSYCVIVAKGHQGRRGKYPYNRVVSGYTVFKNVPGYDMGSSTLREKTSDPDVVLDEFGFISSQPISLVKPPNTVRIFVLGGSAAFGAGQNSHFHGVHPYPDGVHSFPRSIAGQLQNYLAERDPDVKYEVVNAAAYARRFHQSTLLYMETISRLSPDYVVNIEGWNDLGSIVSGSPYADAEEMMPALIALKTRSESWLNRSNTFYVLSTAFDKYRVGANATSVPASDDAASDDAASDDAASVSQADYRRRRADYIAGCRRFEQLLRHHMSILRADQTRLVFVLQPMLPRPGANKDLSAIERKLLEHSRGFADRDSLAMLQFFVDDYLSDRCGELIESAGEIYIDANRELVDVRADVEFYTDYCHLTAAGNEIMAEMIGERILAP